MVIALLQTFNNFSNFIRVNHKCYSNAIRNYQHHARQ